MSDEKEEIIKTLATSLMISIMAAAIRSLMVKQETLLQKIKTFMASVLMGMLMGYILRNSSISQLWTETIISCTVAFFSSVWPVMEKLFVKWIGKKAKDVLPDNDN